MPAKAGAAAAEAPAGPAMDGGAKGGSAFERAHHQAAAAAAAAAADDDTARVDDTARGAADDAALPPVASGPMLGGASLGTAAAGEAPPPPDVPFDRLCNSGGTITSRNWHRKLLRCVAMPPKELYLPLMLHGLPTNFLMLTFRTFGRDFDLPNANKDHLAPLLRDALMPARGRLHRQRSPLLFLKTRLLDCPYLGVPGIVNFVDVRTQWFDAAVERALDDGIKQVVVIAAGYDTRAYRLARPGVRFYEVDLPHASAKKQELVRELLPASEYTWPEFVGADLSRVTLMEALRPTSWDAAKRTMFIIEGLSYYLPAPAFKQQLTAISETAAVGSRLFFDFLHLDCLSGDTWTPGLETLLVAVWNKGEMMQSGVDPRPEALRALLGKFGFRLHEVLDAKDLTSRFHPHVKSWHRWCPHVSPWFGYVAAEKLAAPLKRKDTGAAAPGPEAAP